MFLLFICCIFFKKKKESAFLTRILGGIIMKRIIAAFSLAILSFAAFAGGTLKADDCAAGDIAAGKK